MYNGFRGTHRPQLSFRQFVDGVRLKRRLPVIPRVRNGGVCIALAGNFPKEVIHIELQKVYWMVSIAWIMFQAWEYIRNKKK